jgi:glyoxylate/hydroxypyruvate reductase A
MLNIYVDPGVKDVEVFKKVLTEGDAEYNVFSTIDNIQPEKVDVAVIWLSIPHCLSKFVNLKLLLTSGSGIDHLIKKGKLPDVPIVRLVDFKLRNNVANYVLEAVNDYKNAIQATQESKITVGLLGVGLIGKSNYYKLKEAGYQVNCWVRSNKMRDFDNVYVGQESLTNFVKHSNVLVCQLPYTAETYQILDMKIFDLMPKDGYIINVGRGAHLNELDLMKSIDEGKLYGACLDVFKIEPLPEDNILRNQNTIKLTPHIAGGIFPEDQAKYAVKVIASFFKHGKVEGLVSKEMNY